MNHSFKIPVIVFLLISFTVFLTSCPQAIRLPIVTTTTVTGITQTTATTGGNVTSDGNAEVTSRGVCWATSQNPTTSSSKTSDGTGIGAFTSNITGLSANSTYYVRAYATNSEGTSYGNQVSFTTGQIVAATLTTTAITSITSTTAVSGGNITADGGSAITTRGVCWNTSTNPTTANNITTNGTGTGSFTSNLTNLQPGTTYYLKAYAINSAGNAYGNELTFSTGSVIPVLTTTGVTVITGSSATSGGNITSDGGASVTARGVCWNTSTGPTISNSKTSDGTGSGSFTSNLSGLQPGTTYYVRAYATNSAGTGYGNGLNFITLCTAPTATTNAATNVGTMTVTLNGSVNANGSSTTVTFEFGPSTSYNTTVTASPSPVSGSSTVSANITVNRGSVYHYRVDAISCGGTVYGNDQTFTTLCSPPSATTNDANLIFAATAYIDGTVFCNGFSTTVTFEYGTSTSYGNTITALQSPLTEDSGVTALITGLTPNTTYHFRVKAVNCGGTVYGDDNTFTTSVQVTDKDGNGYSYGFMKDGKVWMTENLKTTKYNNGMSIYNATDASTWANVISGAYCWYNNDATLKDTYGALYNWYTIANGNLCPSGWHVSTNDEWTALATAYGSANSAGYDLKEAGISHWTAPNIANNSSGYTALPGGEREEDGTFLGIGQYGYWWTSTQMISGYAYQWDMIYDFENVYNTDTYEQRGHSVRCVKDY